jgi:hypothetical protein
LLIIPFSGTEGFCGCPTISTLSTVVPHLLTLPSFTVVEYFNLIPPAMIPSVPLKAPLIIQFAPSADIFFKLVVPTKALS